MARESTNSFILKQKPTAWLNYLVIIVGGVVVIKYVLPLLAKSEEEKSADASADAINKASIDYNKTTHPQSWFVTAANAIFTDLDGLNVWGSPGTNNVMKQIVNTEDAKALYKAFGLRAGTSSFASSTKYSLTQWLLDDGLDSYAAIFSNLGLI